MKIINNNISSPFKLTRSIVPQSGEGGAYESGGYDPDSYDRSGDIINSSIEGMGRIVGAALGSRTKGDLNRQDVKSNEMRTNRVEKINKRIEKNTGEKGSEDKKARLTKRKERIQGRIDKTDKRIKDYNSSMLTSNNFLNNQREEN
jgi:hypothetical protein